MNRYLPSNFLDPNGNDVFIEVNQHVHQSCLASNFFWSSPPKLSLSSSRKARPQVSLSSAKTHVARVGSPQKSLLSWDQTGSNGDKSMHKVARDVSCSNRLLLLFGISMSNFSISPGWVEATCKQCDSTGKAHPPGWYGVPRRRGCHGGFKMKWPWHSHHSCGI